MLTRTLLLGVGLLGLAGARAAQAQNYRPFGPGRTYHYREASAVAGGSDSLYTFRVDSLGALPGGDSLLRFNKTSRLYSTGYSPGREQRVNLYGGWMRWNAATGTARFGAAHSSTTVELQTRAVIGQSWPFTPSVQATITARVVQTVLGQPDSVLTISLSDSNTIRLSRRYGIVSGPDFTFYLGQTYRPAPPTQLHTLTLAGLPEAGLPGVDLTWPALVDLQPGDSLFYRNWNFESSSSSCIMITCAGNDSHWQEAIVVRGRQLSASGDTLTVQVDYVTANGAIPTWPLRFTRFNPALSAAGAAPGLGGMTGTYAIMQHLDSLGGLPEARMNALIPDAGSDRWYAPGLGCTYQRDSYAFCCFGFNEKRLIGFYKSGTQIRWGDTRLPPPLSASTAIIRLPASLAPNPAPAGAAPALSFTLDQPQAVSLTLYDAVGRVVWRQTMAGLAAGPQRLPVAGGAALTPGLYRLRVTLADGRQRLLPLVRE